jgi:hypothetical protein
MDLTRGTKTYLFTFKCVTDANIKDFYSVLKTLKDREAPLTPIYYPNKKYLREGITHSPCLVRVERNLFKGKYTNRPWKFIEDVNNVLDFVRRHHTIKAKTFRLADEVRDLM